MRAPTLVACMIAMVATAAIPRTAAAQSSMFGVRGLGLPNRFLSPRSEATGGSFGLFDNESTLNPASLAGVSTVTASFVLAPEWRHWTTPAGTGSLRSTRFPQVFIKGPIPKTPVALGLSFSSYADRDFTLATVDTISPRGVPLPTFDTLSSRGGLNDVRISASYARTSAWSVGASVHILTGSNRIIARRAFGDTTFHTAGSSTELSYSGLGFDVGVIGALSPALSVSMIARKDLRLSEEQDSTKVASFDMPYTFGAGVVYRPSNRLQVGASGVYRTWSGANSDLLALGGVGSRNSMDLSVGLEATTNVKRPYSKPLRLGLRYGQLPFSVLPGGKPHEFGISAGTGTRFAKERAGVDLTLEEVFRSEGSLYRERALQLFVGISVRP
ncbi:MAG: hypothetical protein ABJD11_00280 [Gemmatimonadota bacterium]